MGEEAAAGSCRGADAGAFAAAREVFEEVDETLKQKLSRLMFEGPGEELILTENTQPALMAHSLAVLRVLEKEGVALDIAGYRSAPPGLRIWCGATVDTADLEALTPWLDWAWAQVKQPAAA